MEDPREERNYLKSGSFVAPGAPRPSLAKKQAALPELVAIMERLKGFNAEFKSNFGNRKKHVWVRS